MRKMQGYGRLTHEDLKDDTSGERCRCGLRLPCNDCLPDNAVEFMQTRMRATSLWPVVQDASGVGRVEPSKYLKEKDHAVRFALHTAYGRRFKTKGEK